MHAQETNILGKVFGGYLMREAFDIAYMTASLITTQRIVELLRVDQVLFLRPVTVGSVMDMRSRVTLMEEIESIGKVMRIVVKGYNEFGEQTNNFNFMFAVKDPNF